MGLSGNINFGNFPYPTVGGGGGFGKYFLYNAIDAIIEYLASIMKIVI